MTVCSATEWAPSKPRKIMARVEISSSGALPGIFNFLTAVPEAFVVAVSRNQERKKRKAETSELRDTGTIAPRHTWRGLIRGRTAPPGSSCEE